MLYCSFSIGLLSISPHIACFAYGHVTPQTSQCQTSSSLELVRESEPYQDLVTYGNTLKTKEFNESSSCKTALQDLQENSLQKVEALQNDPAFQETVNILQNNLAQNTAINFSRESQGSLYIFVSFSMSEKALLNIAHEAKQFGATLVLRGFYEGSYLKTAKTLQNTITKTGQGVLVDPELYSLFHITAVPTFVMAKPFQLYAQERTQTPIHDKLQGHVSIRYALEQFSKEGDLKEEAQLFLQGGSAP